MAGSVAAAVGKVHCRASVLRFEVSTVPGPDPGEVDSRAAAVDPKSFFRKKLPDNNVILLGTRHNQPATCHFLMDVMPMLAECGLTHVGLEIASDQQPRLDKFARSGSGLEDVEIFDVIDRPEYRCFLDSVRQAGIRPVALDLPSSLWGAGYSRDEWMAGNIKRVFDRERDPRMVVLVGNLHTLKRVDWVDSKKKNVFLPEYLSKYEPEVKSLSVLSDYNDCPDERCQVRREFESEEKPFVLDAAGLELRPKVLDIIAAKPLDVDQITDAVMIY